jgi:hypothetical protein
MKCALRSSMVALMMLAGTLPSFAQSAPPKAPEKTVYNFDDDKVEGDLKRPDGEVVSPNRKTPQASLIEIRKDFVPEIVKSVEDI